MNAKQGFAVLHKIANAFERKDNPARASRAAQPKPGSTDYQNKAANETLPPPQPRRLFSTFDTNLDIAWISERLDRPVVHLLIEDRASTSYNMAALLLESQTTGEWYLFARRRISLLGHKEGQVNMDDIVERFRELNAHITAWVLPQKTLLKFEAGYALWNQVRPSLVPLLAYGSRDVTWLEQRQRFLMLTRPA